MRITSHRRRAAALAVAGTLALAACGGSDGETSDAGAGTLAPPPATVATTGDVDTESSVDTEPNAVDDDADPPADSVAPAGEATPTETTAPGTTEAAAPEPSFEAPEILRFSAPVVGGGELDLAAIGDRPVLLWFWAPF